MGASVAINYNSNIKSAKDTLKIIKNYGANAVVIKANVSKEKDVKYLIKKTEKSIATSSPTSEKINFDLQFDLRKNAVRPPKKSSSTSSNATTSSTSSLKIQSVNWSTLY